MLRRLGVGLMGMLIGGLAGWLAGTLSGWPLSTMVGILVGGLAAVLWSEQRGSIPHLHELQRPQHASLKIPDPSGGTTEGDDQRA